LLEGMGFIVEEHIVPADVVTRQRDAKLHESRGAHEFGEGKGPTIALNSHGDVVPPGDGWTADPYGAEVRDGHMIGRGVAVSKSDFATYAFALRALQAAAANGAAFDGNIRASLHL
jgi:acetylornithine deacetylase/succinyl-diaminopimelate desuccinylase-like protein